MIFTSMMSRLPHTIGASAVFVSMFALPLLAQAINITTVVRPNGGECLTVGMAYTIEFSWSGPDVEHVALYYRTDGAQPTHLDSSTIKHPINVPQQGTTWSWTPSSSDISETGKVWVDAHGNGHDSLGTWDASNATSSIRSSCAPSPPPSAGSSRTPISPIAERVNINLITETGAAVSWLTDRLSYTHLAYGTTSNNYTMSIPLDEVLTQSHVVVLSGLEAETTYYFQIVSGVALDIRALSEEYSFFTKAPPPSPVRDVFGIAGASTTLLSWINPSDKNFSSTVIMRRSDRFPQTLEDDEMVFKGPETFHRDDELVNGASYYYALFSVNGENKYYPPVTIALTPSINFPPAPELPPTLLGKLLTGTSSRVSTIFFESQDNAVVLRWKNPSEDFLGVHIVRNEGALPANPYDGEVVFRGRSEMFRDINAINGKKYAYGIFTFNWLHEFSKGAFIVAIPAPQKTNKAPEGATLLERTLLTIKNKLDEIENEINSLIRGEAPTINMPAPGRTLYRGLSGNDVKELQRFLSSHTSLYPEGLLTGFFGPLTEAAVRRFQIEYGVLISKDATASDYGIVGPRTRQTIIRITEALTAEERGSAVPLSQRGVHPVFARSDGFHPALLTIKTGEKVLWINSSDTPFWPAANLHPSHQLYSEFDALKELNRNEIYAFTFLKKGTWRYHDHITPVWVGEIIVK